MTVYEKLKEIFKTDTAIAVAFGLERQGIAYWRDVGVPIKRALQIEKVTKGKITAMDVVKG